MTNLNNKDIPLTTKYRPSSFSDTKGQDLPKLILQKIAKKPEGFTRSLILAGEYGTGKSLVNFTDVTTPTGSVKIGDIKAGQDIIGSDGNIYQVTGVFPQGKLPVVEIVFEEDTGLETIIRCSLDHLWQVRELTSKMTLPQNKVVNTQYILDNFKSYDDGFGSNFVVDYPDFYEGDRYKYIKSIKLTDYEEEMTCISVNSSDKLFIVNNNTLTHNTTTSRVFAKALNCETKSGDACNKCTSCVDIQQGSNLYQEFDSAIVGNVEKMKEIRDVLSYSVSNGYKVVVFDECVDYYTPVTLADGTTKNIGEIVHKKLPVEVLSYNLQTNTVESKKITNWFKNSPKQFYKVCTEMGGSLLVSDNHVFITPMGDKPLKDLKVNDSVYVLSLDKKIMVIDILTEISLSEDGILKDSYDIEVEDNHNYFAGNILIHNCHLISKQAMSSLLKVIEEASPNIYYLFPTTNPEKMMDTIKSRSIILTYNALSDEEMKEHLHDICNKESKELPTDVEEFIIRRVKGHARDALQQLQLFFQLGYDDYKKSCVLLDKEFFNIMKFAQTNKITEARETIKNILKNPVPNIKQDFEEVIRKISNSIYISHQEGKNILSDRKLYQRVIQFYLENNRNIHDTNQWFIFLSSLISVIREPEFFNFNS